MTSTVRLSILPAILLAAQFNAQVVWGDEGPGVIPGRVGLALTIDGREIYVIGVASGSSSAAAGIRVNDKVLAIDGKPIEPFQIEDITAKIKGPVGSEVRLTIARDEWDAPRNISLARRPVAQPQPSSNPSLGLEARILESKTKGKRKRIPGYYEVFEYKPARDVVGNQHLVCAESSMSRPQLIERLSRDFGKDAEAERKILEFIGELDAMTPRPGKCLARADEPEWVGKKRMEIVRNLNKPHLFRSNPIPYIFDLRDWSNVVRGERFRHDFKIKYFKSLRDVDGVEFYVLDGEGGQDLVGLREDLVKLSAPVSRLLSDAKSTKERANSTETLIQNLKSASSSQENEDYLAASKVLLQVAAERKDDDLAACQKKNHDSDCNRADLESRRSTSFSEGRIRGNLQNLGEKTIVRAEVSVFFLDNSGQALFYRLFALPIDDVTKRQAGTMPIEVLPIGPNSKVAFEFVFNANSIPIEWSGAIEARLEEITFVEEYVEKLNSLKKEAVAFLEKAREENSPAQAMYKQEEIDLIDESLRKLNVAQ